LKIIIVMEKFIYFLDFKIFSLEQLV